MSYYVYKHTCPNKKVYIGITGMNPINRWSNGRGYSANKPFRDDIRKFGWDKITHEILYSDLTKEEAEKKEIEMIAQYKSNNPKFGYNVKSGGFCGGTKRVCQYTKDERLVATYLSTEEAAVKSGFSQDAIARCCSKNKTKTPGKRDYISCGFIWWYENDRAESIRKFLGL